MLVNPGSPAIIAARVVVAVMVVINLGGPARVLASANCLGFACTAEGARAMLLGEVRQSRPDLLAGSLRPELDALFDKAVERIGQRGFTPEAFGIAAQSLRSILTDWPLGAEDVSARRLEWLRGGTLSICPIWPFC